MTDMFFCYYCMAKHDFAASPCPKCGKKKNYQQKDRQDLPPGTLLHQRYVVGRKLGGGGFGATYIAYDTQTEQVCAVKEFFPHNLCTREENELRVLPNDLESAAFEKHMQSFQSEAKKLSSLSFIKGVVNIYENFEENGTAYFSMEYLEGQTLSEYVRKNGKNGLPLESALKLIYSVLKILRDVHAQGVLHRDISADNVMVLSNGSLKLIDFGAARDMLKTSKTIYSKGVYTAPEQRYGDTQQFCTDLYSVGVLLFFVVTGRVPKQQRVRLESLRRVRKWLPTRLYRLYEKATAGNPNYRYQNTDDMLREIKEIDRVLFKQQNDRNQRRKNILYFLLTVVSLVLVCTLLIVWFKK